MERRARGLEPERPERTVRLRLPTQSPPSPNSVAQALAADRRDSPPSLPHLAAAWHHEYYDELENGGPDRAVQAWLDLELTPLGQEDRRSVPLVSLEATAVLAGRLHVIHQTVLWLLRCCGLRISESYGLVVGDFFLDAAGNGFLMGGAQGGRKFLTRSESRVVAESSHKSAGKTASAYRLLALPAPLTALLLEVVEVFHRTADGVIDPGTRLVPTIRAEGGGQGGFRSALSEVAQVVGESGVEDAYRITPHDFRKSFSTDLAWGDVPRLAARRAMGHRVGVDVFDAVYTLDSRLAEHLLPVARQLEQDLVAVGVTTLMVPTTKRPVYGHNAGPDRIATIDRKLFEAGWQVRDDPKLLGTREVAGLLDRDLQATRRLFGKKIPATKIGREWFCSREDVLAFAGRTTGCSSREQIAEEAGVDYYAVYRMMRRLGIEAATIDNYSRAQLLSSDDAQRLVTELTRLRQLGARSVGVRQAAVMLQTSTSAIYRWVRVGKLTWDGECGVGGARRITRTSIDRETERLARRSPSITVSDFKRVTGLDDADVRALVAAKLLIRMRPDGLTPESVRTWAAGHRPTLLPHPLLQLAWESGDRPSRSNLNQGPVRRHPDEEVDQTGSPGSTDHSGIWSGNPRPRCSMGGDASDERCPRNVV